jgi:hypothetical protein
MSQFVIEEIVVLYFLLGPTLTAPSRKPNYREKEEESYMA